MYILIYIVGLSGDILPVSRYVSLIVSRKY